VRCRPCEVLPRCFSRAASQPLDWGSLSCARFFRFFPAAFGASSGSIISSQTDTLLPQFESSSQPAGISVSLSGTSWVKSYDGSLYRSVLGGISRREASPGFDIRDARLDLARAGSGAVWHDDGLATLDAGAVGCVDDVIDWGRLRAPISSLRTRIVSSRLSTLLRSSLSAASDDFRSSLRRSASSGRPLYVLKALSQASSSRSRMISGHTVVTPSPTACVGKSMPCSLQALIVCAT
jgi:hypothetical protein